MKQFYLSEITTKDGLIHQGIFFSPKKHGKRAILWIHGLSAAFYNGIELFETIAGECERKGWGFAVFNNRGHDLLAGIRKADKKIPGGYTYYPGGAGYEVFRESVQDIDAGVDFLVNQGFPEVVVVGHSSGANKVCYYAAMKKNPHVTGVVLSGPMSDRLDPSVSQEKRKKDLDFMHTLIKEGKGDTLLLGYHFFPISPKRYISLFEPGTAEDTFDYGDIEPKMTYYSKIRLPLLVVLAENDEYADRPVSSIRRVFDSCAKSKQYKSVVIPGALHKFNGAEKEITGKLVSWIASI